MYLYIAKNIFYKFKNHTLFYFATALFILQQCIHIAHHVKSKLSKDITKFKICSLFGNLWN